MNNLLKSKSFWAIAALIVLGVLYMQLKPESQPEYTTAAVAKQALAQTVSVTGAVRGSSEIELNFETTGEVAEVLVVKGQTVAVGDTLAKLSSDQINSQIIANRAAVAAAQAELDKLLAGATPEEILVSQEKVSSAETTLALRNQDLLDLESEIAVDRIVKEAAITSAERDLETTRDNLIRSMENELFDATTALTRLDDILTDSDKTSTLGALNTAVKNQTIAVYNTALSLKNSADSLVATADASKLDDDIEAALTATYAALSEVAEGLSLMHSTLVYTVSNNGYSDADITTDKNNVTSDQATVTAGITNVQTSEGAWESDQTAVTNAENDLSSFEATSASSLNAAQGAVDSAEAALSLAQAELALLTAPARDEDIALQRSNVLKAQAQLAQVQDDLDKITLFAPTAGVITDIEYEVGETTSLTVPAIMMLGDSDLEIEIDIPESDIAKVAAGQTASITLDAFGDEVIFPGHIVFIDPAETVIQDVVYYQIVATFDNEAIGAKPGMTANVDIVTNELEDVLVIPARAVKQNGAKYVDVLESGLVISKEVTTGLRGDDGLIEIVSGLAEGEQVITFVKE